MARTAWINSDLSVASNLLCSSVQLCTGLVNWPSRELPIAGSLARGDGPDPQLVSAGPGPLMAV